MAINRVILQGRLTGDPEIRQTGGGMPVVSFALAVNDRRKNKAGEWEEYASFIDCSMFGERAQKVSAYLYKGKAVTIDGKVRQRRWEAQDGSKRSKIEVLVDDIALGEKVPQNGSGGPTRASQGNTPGTAGNAGGDYYDADIPF